jgi:hypothetical protein
MEQTKNFSTPHQRIVSNMQIDIAAKEKKSLVKVTATSCLSSIIALPILLPFRQFNQSSLSK